MKKIYTILIILMMLNLITGINSTAATISLKDFKTPSKYIPLDNIIIKDREYRVFKSDDDDKSNNYIYATVDNNKIVNFKVNENEIKNPNNNNNKITTNLNLYLTSTKNYNEYHATASKLEKAQQKLRTAQKKLEEANYNIKHTGIHINEKGETEAKKKAEQAKKRAEKEVTKAEKEVESIQNTRQKALNKIDPNYLSTKKIASLSPETGDSEILLKLNLKEISENQKKALQEITRDNDFRKDTNAYIDLQTRQYKAKQIALRNGDNSAQIKEINEKLNELMNKNDNLYNNNDNKGIWSNEFDNDQEILELRKKINKINLKTNYQNAIDKYNNCEDNCDDEKAALNRAKEAYQVNYNKQLANNLFSNLNIDEPSSCANSITKDCISAIKNIVCTTDQCEEDKQIALENAKNGQKETIVKKGIMANAIDIINMAQDTRGRNSYKLFFGNKDHDLIGDNLDFKSKICEAKVGGYLDKEFDVGGGISKFNEDGETISFIKAKRSKITPDNKVALTYDVYLMPDQDVTFFVAVKYKEGGTNNYKKIKILNAINISDDDSKHIYKTITLTNITKGSSDFSIGMIATIPGTNNIQYFENTKIRLISQGTFFSVTQFNDEPVNQELDENGNPITNTEAKPITSEEILDTMNW